MCIVAVFRQKPEYPLVMYPDPNCSLEDIQNGKGKGNNDDYLLIYVARNDRVTKLSQQGKPRDAKATEEVVNF